MVAVPCVLAAAVTLALTLVPQLHASPQSAEQPVFGGFDLPSNDQDLVPDSQLLPPDKPSVSFEPVVDEDLMQEVLQEKARQSSSYGRSEKTRVHSKHLKPSKHDIEYDNEADDTEGCHEHDDDDEEKDGGNMIVNQQHEDISEASPSTKRPLVELL